MPLGNFVAGRYNGTWVANLAAGGSPLAPLNLGLTDDGFGINVTHAGEMINKSDGYGEALIEIIHQGFSEVSIEFQMLEWLVSGLQMAFPYATPFIQGGTVISSGQVGVRASDFVGSLVLTVQQGTPAKDSPAAVAVPFPIISPNFPIKWMHNSKLRRLPIKLLALPYTETVGSEAIYMNFT